MSDATCVDESCSSRGRDGECECHQPPPWLGRVRAEVDAIAEWIDETHRRSCVYCGERSEHEDHLLPVPYTGPLWRRHVPTVPACSSCNGILSCRLIPIIADRSAVLAVALRRKYAKLLAVGPYQSDPDEHGPMLRQFIEARRAKRLVIRTRLAFLDLGGACYADPSALLD